MTTTITKLYPLLKDIGLDDKKSQEFIEIIENSYRSETEQEIKKLVTNETFLTETTKLREDMAVLRGEMAKIREEVANMKVELIKWNVGTIIAVAGVIAAIVKLIG